VTKDTDELVVVDCDNTFGLPRKEIDDGLTLLYLLGRPSVRITAVTTTYGNGTARESTSQSKYLLRTMEREDIPVIEGAAEPGDEQTAAVQSLLELSEEHEGRLTVLALGPVTNVAAAIRRDPSFPDRLKGVVCMGGYLEPLRIGWRRVSELNLSADPPASYSVLNARCPVTLMSAQVCLQAPFGLRDLRRLGPWNRRFRKYVRNWLLAFGFYHTGRGVFYLWDLLPAVYLEFPSLFDERRVELTSSIGDLESGTLKIRDTDQREGTLNLPSTINDPGKFKDILFESWEKRGRRR
jgi:inosine-uridine nucleoside N-ribohydrolase